MIRVFSLDIKYPLDAVVEDMLDAKELIKTYRKDHPRHRRVLAPGPQGVSDGEEAQASNQREARQAPQRDPEAGKAGQNPEYRGSW